MSTSLYASAAEQARPFLAELAREMRLGLVNEDAARSEVDRILDEALDVAYRIEESSIRAELIAA